MIIQAAEGNNSGNRKAVSAYQVLHFEEFIAGVYSVLKGEKFNYDLPTKRAQIRYERGRQFATFAAGQKNLSLS